MAWLAHSYCYLGRDQEIISKHRQIKVSHYGKIDNIWTVPNVYIIIKCRLSDFIDVNKEGQLSDVLMSNLFIERRSSDVFNVKTSLSNAVLVTFIVKTFLSNVI